MNFNRLVASQFGVISRSQARALGLTSNIIYRKVQNQDWQRVHPAVFRLSTFPISWEQRLMAAWLWAGENAVISHRSAGAVLKFESIPRSFLDLAVPKWRQTPDPKMKLFTTKVWLPGDTAKLGPFTCTSPTRTVIDLATVLAPNHLEEVLEESLRKRLTTIQKLELRLVELQFKGRRGTLSLNRLLGLRDPQTTLTQTGFEVRSIQMLRRLGLPEPLRQFQIGDATVDLAYPEAGIAIECDSITFHSQPKDVIKDARRGNQIISLGWQLFRITWNDLLSPDSVVARQISKAYSSKMLRRAN